MKLDGRNWKWSCNPDPRSQLLWPGVVQVAWEEEICDCKWRVWVHYRANYRALTFRPSKIGWKPITKVSWRQPTLPGNVNLDVNVKRNLRLAPIIIGEAIQNDEMARYKTELILWRQINAVQHIFAMMNFRYNLILIKKFWDNFWHNAPCNF